MLGLVSCFLTVNTVLFGLVTVYVFFQGSNKNAMLGLVSCVLTLNTLLISLVTVLVFSRDFTTRLCWALYLVFSL